MACLLALSPFADAAAATAPVATPYTLARSDVRIVRSPAGNAYRIMIAWPEAPPPVAGYPVLYVLDGDSWFATAAEAMARVDRMAARKGWTPGIVVAIGYPGGDRRATDYTPPPAAADGSGGADRFLDVIERQVKPLVAASWRVDPARQAIFGHSYGGLFVLHALFTRPAAFSTYVASSPSIWFGDRRVLAEERAFLRAPATPGSRRLVMTAAEYDQSWRPGADEPSAQDKALIASRRMVDDARDLARQLRAAAPRGLDTRFRVLAGEDHGTAPSVALATAVSTVFATGSDGPR